MPPRVSVVMACYNSAAWLDLAINSILAQTVRDIELVIVDDGSSDTSPALIQAAASRDDRIVVISKSNSGLADSLNVGVSRAGGDWIARIDADDLSDPARLQTQLEIAAAAPHSVFIGSGFHEITSAGDLLATHSYPTAHADLVRRLERMQGFPPHSSAMFRKSAFDHVGGYRAKITRAEDWDLWLRLAEIGELAASTRPLVSIRRHAGQLSNDAETQLCQAYAATAAHFLRLSGSPDPLAKAPEFYLTWSRFALQQRRVIEQRRSWLEARARYQATPGPRKIIRLALDIIGSGHAIGLVTTKLRGSSVPRRLARDWLRTDRAVRSVILT